MGWLTLVIIIAIIVLGVYALKALAGIARTIISIVLAVVIIGLLFSFVSDKEMGPTSASITESGIRTINHTINETTNLVVTLPEKAKDRTPRRLTPSAPMTTDWE